LDPEGRPNLAGRAGSAPGGIDQRDIGPDEDLVLDHERDLAAAVLDEIGEAQVSQVSFDTC